MAEQAVPVGRHSRPQHRQYHSSSSGDGRMPDTVYQKLLGIDRPLKRTPDQYNIGEIALEPRSGFNTLSYQGPKMQLLEQVEQDVDIKIGTPYVATGVIEVDEDAQAILRTTNRLIRLGKIGAHAHRRFATDLAGREMALPVVIDAIADGEAEGRAGEKAAYLIPNPDWRTRGRLARAGGWGVGGRTVVEGLVREDPQGQDTVTIQTTKGGNWFPGKRTKIILDGGGPLLNSEINGRPLREEPVARNDRVRLPVEFVGGKMVLAGDASLLQFSQDHEAEYTERVQAAEKIFDDFVSARTDNERLSIMRPDGDGWKISEPHARESVARYLFAELRQEEQLLTPSQQEDMWDLIFSMDQDARPFIFDRSINNKPDPRREALDRYFKKITANGETPMMAEAMTPEQLLSLMTRMSVGDDSSFALADFVTLITDYHGQFGQEAARKFIYNVIYTREEQFRTGSNPEAAMYGLLEAMPYIREMDPIYQADVLAHIINSGGVLAHTDPDTWENANSLYNLLEESLAGLGSAAYPGEDYSTVNNDVLLALLEHMDYIKGWQNHLPYGLGEHMDLTFILRDLELMNMVRGEQNALQDEPIERLNGQVANEAQLDQLLAQIG